jgi:hypothetical protein
MMCCQVNIDKKGKAYIEWYNANSTNSRTEDEKEAADRVAMEAIKHLIDEREAKGGYVSLEPSRI